MEFIICVFAAFGAIMFWKKIVKPLLPNRQNVERGLVAVRAANFIGMVEIAKTESVEEANRIVAEYDTDSFFEIDTARLMIKEMYAGKQLPMIAHARSLGFKG